MTKSDGNKASLSWITFTVDTRNDLALHRYKRKFVRTVSGGLDLCCEQKLTYTDANILVTFFDNYIIIKNA